MRSQPAAVHVQRITAALVGCSALCPFLTGGSAARAAEPSGWREVLSFEGHDSQVWCVSFSPDGKTVASGSGGFLRAPGQLKLWDAATGQEVATANESRSIRWVSFSPDGKFVVTAEHDSTAKLRKAETLQILRTVRHESGLDTAVFSPDGRAFATTSWDKTIRLWDVATGQPIQTFTANTREVYTAAFRPDGRQIASGGHDELVRLWDVETGQVDHVLRGHEDVVHCVAFSPDGKSLASVSWDRSVKLWDVQSGTLIRSLQGHTVQVLAVAFSPKGDTLASVSGRWGEGGSPDPAPGELIVWDASSGRALATARGHEDRIFGVAYSPDGQTIATASWDGTVKLWRQDGQAERR